MTNGFRFGIAALLLLFSRASKGQSAKDWAERTFNGMTNEQKIAQLLVVRAHSDLGKEHIAQVESLIKGYGVGGLCFFQGGPVRQALLTNQYRSLSKVPLMICMDAEWGLGMRLDSVPLYPRQLMLGAANDESLVRHIGNAIGVQCKRMGVQVNYAPVVDVNNNPSNPVINDRSFGEDPHLVASLGTAYCKGLQQTGTMACAKHFPGHGDVSVDSHLDLPLVRKSLDSLQDLELVPFKKLARAGAGSMMVAHLSVPAIDATEHLASSLSPIAINGLLKHKIGFNGIVFTDALEMKGITKYFPQGEATAMALAAGNDMICLPGNVAEAITATMAAIEKGRLTWKDIDEKVKKVLETKYRMGLAALLPIDTAHLIQDLNQNTQALFMESARKSLTVVKMGPSVSKPLADWEKTVYISIGAPPNLISQKLKESTGCTVFSCCHAKYNGGKSSNVSIEPAPGQKFTDDTSAFQQVMSIIDSVWKNGYAKIIVGVHGYSRRPANDFGIGGAARYLIERLQQKEGAVFLFFGNPYALKFAAKAGTLVACYEDSDATQATAAEWLLGGFKSKGQLPVTVCEELPIGTGSRARSNFFNHRSLSSSK